MIKKWDKIETVLKEIENSNVEYVILRSAKEIIFDSGYLKARMLLKKVRGVECHIIDIENAEKYLNINRWIFDKYHAGKITYGEMEQIIEFFAMLTYDDTIENKEMLLKELALEILELELR